MRVWWIRCDVFAHERFRYRLIFYGKRETNLVERRLFCSVGAWVLVRFECVIPIEFLQQSALYQFFAFSTFHCTELCFLYDWQTRNGRYSMNKTVAQQLLVSFASRDQLAFILSITFLDMLVIRRLFFFLRLIIWDLSMADFQSRICFVLNVWEWSLMKSSLLVFCK